MQLWPGAEHSKCRREQGSNLGLCFGQVFIWEEKTLLLNLGSWVLDPGGTSDRRAGPGPASGETVGGAVPTARLGPSACGAAPSALLCPCPVAVTPHVLDVSLEQSATLTCVCFLLPANVP